MPSKHFRQCQNLTDLHNTGILCGSVTLAAVAKVVLDRCMRQNVTKDRSTQKKTHNRTVEFNFEFLDDYKMFLKLHPKQSSDDEEMKSRLPKTHSARSSLKDKEENQGFIAQCGPEVFLPKYHPLALMVS